MELAEKNSCKFHPVSAFATEGASSNNNTNLVNKVSAGNRRNNRPQGTVKCSQCSGNHLSRACRFKDAWCYNYRQIVHIASACKSGALRRQGKGRIQSLAVDAPAKDENESQSSEDEIFVLYATNSNRVGRGFHVEVAVNGESINMEMTQQLIIPS